MDRRTGRKRLLDMFRRLLDAFGPQGWWPGGSPFEIAVGAILTQNTNWKNVERAISNLKADRSLSARDINSMTDVRLAGLIRPAGYYNVKARRVKEFVRFLVEGYGGSMRRMGRQDDMRLRQELLGVNGIGPETADSILLYALGKPVFVIDSYTRRVLSRHGLMEHDVSYPELQSFFHKYLPVRERLYLYNEFHALFVATGKACCRPSRPLCGACPLEGF